MTSLQMPKVHNPTIESKEKIIADISKILNKANILADDVEIRPYETDALTR